MGLEPVWGLVIDCPRDCIATVVMLYGGGPIRLLRLESWQKFMRPTKDGSGIA
jgi:hypothetical protein